jgi:holo-[acyl-carrier protein] synthase
MIYGIGIDLVNIPRMATVIARWGERFTGRVFSPQEIEVCGRRAHPASAYAIRFAAKEAFSKAMGLGMKGGLSWREIEVFNDPRGRPGLRIYGRSLEICTQERIGSIHLSLSDEGDYGSAVVVLEKIDGPGHGQEVHPT